MLGWLKRIAAPVVAICLIAVAGGARAESIFVVGQTVAADFDPGEFEWTYNMNAVVSEVQNGDFFVIVDFNGYVAGSEFNPVGWNFSTEVTTAVFAPALGTPIGPPLPDTSAVNLRWTRTGGAIFAATIAPLGFFGADSIQALPQPTTLVAQDHNILPGPTFGMTQGNTQPIVGPAVPLPGVAWAGIALLGGLGGVRGLKKRFRRSGEVVTA